MIVDGRAIAEKVYERTAARVRELRRAPEMTIITCAPNFETKKYLALKEKKAAQVGILTTVIDLPEKCSTEMMIATIMESIPVSDAIVVQLPLPPQIDTDAVLRAVPVTHDADALNTETSTVLSPVVGAIDVILREHNVPIAERHVVIIGSGRLVGLPAHTWFTRLGASVSIVTKDTADVAYYTKPADIIVCGAGVPGLLTPDMVKEGVVILDGGTSEDGGVLKGDADPACAEKAALFTPVPGGIGPITIAILLENVVKLSRGH